MPPAVRLILTLSGVPPFGRALVGSGRVWLVELRPGEPSGSRVDSRGPEAGVEHWLWQPGEPMPDGIPELTEDEAALVSAAAARALPTRSRRLDGADWDDPRARPPDPPGPAARTDRPA